MPSDLVKLAAEKNIHVFLEAYGITNDQGEKLDFKDHAYLWDIYEDFTPKQAILKAAQIGFSTCANIKAMYAAKTKGLDIIYSLPSAADIKDFVSGKTNRLISNNPIFQQWTQDKDSIEQKRIGNNVIYFKGTWTERAAIATPADLYISDETDRSKQEIVTQYKTRLQHSKFAWEWYFSNPSAPGHGVDKHWQNSDQKHWFIKCQGCNYEWYLTMDNIMGNPAYFGCLKCKRELDRHRGRWVKRFQNKEVSGYWISLLMSPRVTAQQILDKKSGKDAFTEEQFTNFVLGQPYIGKGNVLTKQMFVQNLMGTTNPMNSRVIIGADTGIGINLVAGNKSGLFYYSKTKDYTELENLLLRWPNAIAIIDGLGDITGPRGLMEKYPNRVFLCFFGRDRKTEELVRWSDKDSSVVADRSRCIQLVVDEFSERRIPVYGTEADWYDFMNEFLGMYRTIEESDIGPPVYEWHKPSTGRCDYPFATVYWRIGMDRFRDTSTTFHEPAGANFAQTGYEANSVGGVFAPKV